MAGSFPILSVADLPSTQRFYERLGFAETYRFPPEGEAAFVVLERGDASLGLGAGGAADTFAYWIDVDDVDDSVASLRAAGTPITAEPEDRPWGERVASVRDPAGNLVHLGSAAVHASEGGSQPRR